VTLTTSADVEGRTSFNTDAIYSPPYAYATNDTVTVDAPASVVCNGQTYDYLSMTLVHYVSGVPVAFVDDLVSARQVSLWLETAPPPGGSCAVFLYLNYRKSVSLTHYVWLFITTGVNKYGWCAWKQYLHWDNSPIFFTPADVNGVNYIDGSAGHLTGSRGFPHKTGLLLSFMFPGSMDMGGGPPWDYYEHHLIKSFKAGSIDLECCFDTTHQRAMPSGHENTLYVHGLYKKPEDPCVDFQCEELP